MSIPEYREGKLREQVAELESKLAATKQKLEAAEARESALVKSVNTINDNLQGWKQRAEAAESRIKASQAQEPFMLMESSTIIKEDKAYGMQKVLSYGDKIYLQPIISPAEAELEIKVKE